MEKLGRSPPTREFSRDSEFISVDPRELFI
jgi:hypothetical protein